MKKTILDEMQEQIVLKMESVGHGIAFWGLIISIVIQVALAADFKQIVAEWAVFMVLCIHMLYGSIKHGIWSRKSKPSSKFNIIASLLAALTVGFMVFCLAARHGWDTIRVIQIVSITFTITFLLCIVLLTISVKLYNARRSALDQE